MYIERKLDPMTGEAAYIMDGEEKVTDFYAFVNGKRISADIIALDTKEGWVDIELPVLEKPVEIRAISEEDAGSKVNPEEVKIAKHSMTIKRLEGEITIRKTF